MAYVDGFVFTVPKKNIAAYKKMARDASKIWMKYGALDYKECMIDDPKPDQVILTFPKLVNVKPTETIWFSYIVFKSRAHRNQVNAKVMKDPAMHPDNPDFMKNMPFDMNRMAYGGFKVEVEGKK